MAETDNESYSNHSQTFWMLNSQNFALVIFLNKKFLNKCPIAQ